jgi:hypothetical protein
MSILLGVIKQSVHRSPLGQLFITLLHEHLDDDDGIMKKANHEINEERERSCFLHLFRNLETRSRANRGEQIAFVG